jgi:DNA segregation ATPase FtsK/SpoIIIE, S-DNA-T family
MERSRLNREFFGVLVSVTALLIIISLLSYAPRDPSLNTSTRPIETQNRVGIVGAYLADVLLQGFGLASYLLPIFLCLVAFQMFRSNYRKIPLSKFAGYGVFLISIAVILDLFVDTDVARESGGIIGGFLKESVLIPLFGRISTVLIATTGLLASVMLLTEHSLFDIAKGMKKSADGLRKIVAPSLANLFKEMKEKTEKRKGENTKKERPDYVPPPILVKEEASQDPVKKTGKKTVALQEQYKLPEINEGYKLPPSDLLDPPAGEQFKIDKETLHANSLILQKKLADFGVEGEVVAVRPGPVITMYEFKPAPGVKVRRIVMLADDLAMALRAVSVRILAPIPGESVVGIEIPNPRRFQTHLRSGQGHRRNSVRDGLGPDAPRLGRRRHRHWKIRLH